MYIDIVQNIYNIKYIDLKCLRVCDSGGDSLPIGCIKEFEKMSGAIITEGYGLTETSSLTHFNISATEGKIFVRFFGNGEPTLFKKTIIEIVDFCYLIDKNSKFELQTNRTYDEESADCLFYGKYDPEKESIYAIKSKNCKAVRYLAKIMLAEGVEKMAHTSIRRDIRN